METGKKSAASEPCDSLQGHNQLEETPGGGQRHGEFRACATLTGHCGDTMSIELVIKDDQVIESSFRGTGCGHSLACGRFVAENARGKNVDQLPELSPDRIVAHLADIPLQEYHCARLAYETLMGAVDSYFCAFAGKRKVRRKTPLCPCESGAGVRRPPSRIPEQSEENAEPEIREDDRQRGQR